MIRRQHSPIPSLQPPGASGQYREDVVGKTCVCTVHDRSALLYGHSLWLIRDRCDSDMNTQCIMGPCRDNLLGKWERMLSNLQMVFLFRDSGGLKDPGRCAVVAKIIN